MSLSTQVYVWPTSPSTLREILGLDSVSSSNCHGTTTSKNHDRCRLHVAKGSPIVVSDLLSQIVKKNNFEAAKSLLQKVSKLVLCHVHNKKKQDIPWFTSWEKKLSLYKSPVIEVKKEEEGEDVKSVLVGLRDKSMESEKISLATPLKQVKSRASSPKEAVKKEEEPSLVVLYPTVPTPKRSLARSQTQHTFEPYAKTLSTTAINLRIKNLILRSLLENEKKSDGKIYLFTFPNNYHDRAPYLKIGCTNNIADRMRSWEYKCGYKPKLLAEFSADNYVKVERLVHAQLQNKRLREAGGCPACGTKHKEWFDIRSQKAFSAIGLWTTWTRQEPYDENGCLKKDWAKRVNRVDLSDPNCWEEFVSGEYEDEDEDEDEFDSDDTYYSADDDSHFFNTEEADN